MRTTSRLVASTVVLGAGLVMAAPAASAQQTCAYPFDCPPLGGGSEVPASGSGSGSGSGETPTYGSGSPTSLPFTGGEVTLMALAGLAAVGGGGVLVAAGRKRATA